MTDEYLNLHRDSWSKYTIGEHPNKVFCTLTEEGVDMFMLPLLPLVSPATLQCVLGDGSITDECYFIDWVCLTEKEKGIVVDKMCALHPEWKWHEVYRENETKKKLPLRKKLVESVIIPAEMFA